MRGTVKGQIDIPSSMDFWNGRQWTTGALSMQTVCKLLQLCSFCLLMSPLEEYCKLGLRQIGHYVVANVDR